MEIGFPNFQRKTERNPFSFDTFTATIEKKVFLTKQLDKVKKMNNNAYV